MRKKIISKSKNIRTDIITNKKHNRSDLHRVVYSRKNNCLYWDNDNKIQGRSVYFSKENQLVNTMIKKSILERRLKSKNIFEQTSYEKIINDLLTLTS